MEPLSDRWATPWDLFESIADRWGQFTIDVAASAHNAKCSRYFDPCTDGLAQSWAGERVWCNPPYSTIRPWVQKAWDECGQAELIAMLLPANRTEQEWWHELVEPHRDQGGPLSVHFIRRRVRFLNDAGQTCTSPVHGNCLLIWTHDD